MRKREAYNVSAVAITALEAATPSTLRYQDSTGCHRGGPPGQEVSNLDIEIDQADAMIDERFRRHRHAEIILSMSGFGVTLGATGGDMSVFDSVDRLAGVAGLAPVPRDSGRFIGNLKCPAATTDACCGSVSWPRTSPFAPTLHRVATTTANAPKENAIPKQC